MICPWALKDEFLKTYHDEEWCRPHHDDTYLFEMLVLEGAQAGLSWSTILKRREGYRKTFFHFDMLFSRRQALSMTIWKAALSAVQTGPDLLSQEGVCILFPFSVIE